jgi:DNA-binding response OmpR family regulator
MPRILLADDDTELCEMISEYLASDGFSVVTVNNGDEALTLASTDQFDLIILDVMMPVTNGFDVLRALRNESSTPVLMLTARDEDTDSIVGLELGADDYLGKPCNPRVLVARIRALLRRAEFHYLGMDGENAVDVLKVMDLEMHPGSRTVTCQGRAVNMTSTEYAVLAVLLRNAGRAVPKVELSGTALGRKFARYDRSMDMHVSRVRKKLGPFNDGEERIKTVRGIGYQYVVKPA